jgi:hypothetical protein
MSTTHGNVDLQRHCEQTDEAYHGVNEDLAGAVSENSEIKHADAQLGSAEDDLVDEAQGVRQPGGSHGVCGALKSLTLAHAVHDADAVQNRQGDGSKLGWYVRTESYTPDGGTDPRD